jgi:acetyl esterase/lipase
MNTYAGRRICRFRALPWCLLCASVSLWFLLGAVQAARAEQNTAPPIQTYEVDAVRGINYAGDGNPRHELDLYLPRGRKDFPVLFFIHGGAWVAGNKDNFLGLFSYADVGKTFARLGIGTVMPNYRLSPQVQHPAHIEDVARAFAWTYRHIARYGGRADQIVVGGHSAGGHLACLLATEARYLRKEGLSTDVIKGVVSVSGVYQLDPVRVKVAAPMLADDKVDVEVDPYRLVFGDDPQVRKAAAPRSHVRPGLPPFLLMYAIPYELPTLAEMAKDFAAALAASKCEVQLLPVRPRTHASIIFNATQASDPVVRAVVRFIDRNTRPPASGADEKKK